MRRDLAGGKRGNGRLRQKFHSPRQRLVRRPDPRKIRIGKPDDSLTSVAGLVPFRVYLDDIGLDGQLEHLFGHLKTGDAVVYPMANTMHQLIDANALGVQRIFGLEGLAADPLFVFLSGGSVPSIDTSYRDLERFGPEDIAVLEEIMAFHGRAIPIPRRCSTVHLDIDSTVEPLFGSQECAVRGYNPRYHGRPSYHPIIAHIPESGGYVAAMLRPGNTTLGRGDVPFIKDIVERTKLELGPGKKLRVRIDSAGDCTEIMSAIEDLRVTFVTKARMTEDLRNAIGATEDWVTVEWDEDGKPLRQFAEVKFRRDEWRKAGRCFRVVALRTREERQGGQTFIWQDLEYTVHAFITCDHETFGDDIISEYDYRAGIEPMIAELKICWGIGKVPSRSFDANQAMFLLKLLTANLVRRYVAAKAPEIISWRVDWVRRILFCVPGLLRSRSHGHTLRLPTNSYLSRWLY